MKDTQKATPVAQKMISVVDKKNCCSGTNCTCGSDCCCNTDWAREWFKCGMMLLSALIVAASVFYVGAGCPMKDRFHSKHFNALKPEKSANADKQVREFIMNNPKLLIDTVNKYYQELERKQQEATPQVAPEKVVADIIADKTNYSLGNPKGKFVIIEFFDYQCGWCKKTNKEMAAAVASKEGKNIRWIPIDSPIFGEDSERIARFVMAAGKQKKYAEMHDAVGNVEGKVDEAKLIELAKGLKLDIEKLKKDANSQAMKDKLAANRQLANELGVNGVPMLIVDGKINSGALIGDRLAEAVKASQAKK